MLFFGHLSNIESLSTGAPHKTLNLLFALEIVIIKSINNCRYNSILHKSYHFIDWIESYFLCTFSMELYRQLSALWRCRVRDTSTIASIVSHTRVRLDHPVVLWRWRCTPLKRPTKPTFISSLSSSPPISPNVAQCRVSLPFSTVEEKKRVIDVLFDKFGPAGLIDTLVIIRNDSTGQIVTHWWSPLSDHNDNPRKVAIINVSAAAPVGRISSQLYNDTFEMCHAGMERSCVLHNSYIQ